jgi:hypothetical protein
MDLLFQRINVLKVFLCFTHVVAHNHNLYVSSFQMFENFIVQWQDNNLNLADYGLGFIPEPIARMDVFTGKPTTFQNNLLKGIEFLQYRVDMSREPEDRITKVS